MASTSCPVCELSNLWVDQSTSHPVRKMAICKLSSNFPFTVWHFQLDNKSSTTQFSPKVHFWRTRPDPEWQEIHLTWKNAVPIIRRATGITELEQHPFHWDPVVDERMRPGHRLGLVLCVPSVLWHWCWVAEKHHASKNHIPLIPDVLFQERWRRRPKVEPADPGSPGKTAEQQ